MAERIVLVSKANSQSPSATIIDGIHSVLINADDAQTTPQVLASAVAQCVLAGHTAIETGYFDTVQLVGDLTAGPLKDNLDAIIFLERAQQKVEGP